MANGIINGPVLNGAHWAMMNKNLDPSTHRLRNAFGLSAGLIIGRQFMNAAVGETTTGEKVGKDDVPFFLRPIHGVLSYNHFSDDPKDRWMKVVDYVIPAALGGGGAMLGSYDFALDPNVGGIGLAAREAQKDLSKLTLDKAELMAKFTQSHPWRGLAGLTAMNGSASGFGLVPGLNNYGSTLGVAFSGSVMRDKYSTPYLPWLQKFISGNKHYYPYSPTSMLPRVREYLVHNKDANPKQLKDMAYAILEPWFGESVKPSHVEAFVGELTAVRNKFFQSGGVPEKAKADLVKELDAVLMGTGLEKTIKKVGLNPAEATIGRNGFIEWTARALGYGGRLDEVGRSFRRAYGARNNIAVPLENLARVKNFPHDGRVLMTGGAVVGLGALAIGAMALDARRWHQADNEELLHTKQASEQHVNGLSEEPPNAEEPHRHIKAGIADRYQHQKELLQAKKAKGEQGFAEWLNGKPLRFMEWVTDGFNSPETVGLHRLSCALGLTGGGVVGMRIAEALTGRNFAGANVPLEKLPDVLKPLYKKLAYNPFSDAPKDKWGFVFHLAIPAVFSTAGIITASELFFRKRKTEAGKAEYIDDYETKASMAEAGPWTALTSTAALLATPSGNIFLPIPGINYGMSLATRFTLSSGRKVIFPGLGELWSGNASRYPFGPTLLRDHMIKYAVNNPSPHPDQLEEMTIGILKPWFKDVTGEQILSFVQKVEADRDKFLAEGGVPEESKKALEKELIAHFKGAGLEKTLKEIGLDPLKASLGENGISSTIAKYLGAAKPLEDIHKEYAKKYTERVHVSRTAQPDVASARA